jgi:hypothetical protein
MSQLQKSCVKAQFSYTGRLERSVELSVTKEFMQEAAEEVKGEGEVSRTDEGAFVQETRMVGDNLSSTNF